MSKSVCESLRATADRFRGWSYGGNAEPDPRLLMRQAADEIERLMGVYAAASDLCDDPFGSLNQRKFYRLREAFYA